ncbi:MAG TPA: low temperature requirement protein A [Gaiellaceae bacterium]|nr:low temperature requirement protein A [Gaiellaceae bacterium]
MASFARFLEPPRLRTLETDEERRATWLELFLDLVFVAAIAQVASILSTDPTAAGFGRFLVLFLPIGWAWAGFTFYATRFDTDDLVYRCLTLLGMFAVAGLASTVPDALNGGQNAFVVAYVSVRLILIALYVRVYRDLEVARPVARWFIFMFGLAVCDWLISLAVPVPWKYVFWGLALALEHAAPIRAWRLLRGMPVDPKHIPERFGLLIIIVLGESVIGVVLGTAHVDWTVLSGAVAFAGFLAAAAIWWLYFDFLDAASVVTRNVRSGITFVYAHYFVAAGIAALGVGVKLAIFSVGPGPAYDDIGWIAAAGTALCMAGLAAIQLATPPGLLDSDVVLRLITAALACVLVLASSLLSPVVILWLLAAVLVAQVAFELAAHEGHTSELPGPL